MQSKYRNHAVIFTLVILLSTAAWAMSSNSSAFSLQRSEVYVSAKDALDDGQWRRASELFDSVADEGGQDADAALYWAAYALHKQGRSREAAERIGTLLDTYPNSGWTDDAEALSVEIDETDPTEIADEELKIYALNSLIHADAERAVPVLEEFLAGSSSMKLKKQALFVLSQSRSPRAQQVLADIATGNSHPDLRREAVQYLGMSGDPASRSVLESIYKQSADVEVKRMVLESFMIAGDRSRLLSAAKDEPDPPLRRHAIEMLGVLGAGTELEELYASESSPEIKRALLEGLMIGNRKEAVYEISTSEADPKMRRMAIEYLGVMGAGEELRRLYDQEGTPELRGQILEAYMIGGDIEALEQAARGETDPVLRRRAIEYLGVSGGERSGTILAELYQTAASQEERRQIIEALFIQNNVPALVEIIQSESDTQLKRMALERLSLLGSDEAVDFLIEALQETGDGR